MGKYFEKMQKRGENISPEIKKHYTPESLVKYCLKQINHNNNDSFLDVGSGLNMVFYKNIKSKNKDWVEIEKGKDFFKYTKRVDYCIGNPPYRKLWTYFNKSFEISNKGVCFLIAIDGINSLTPKRLDELADKGFYLTKISIVNVKKWFGRYFFVQFTREKEKSIVNWERKTFKDEEEEAFEDFKR